MRRKLLKKDVISSWRGAKRMTQSDFMVLLEKHGGGLRSRSHISHLEAGRAGVSPRVAQALRKVTGLTDAELFFVEGNSDQSSAVPAPLVQPEPVAVPVESAPPDNALNTLEDTQKQLLEMAIKLSDAIRDLKQRQR